MLFMGNQPTRRGPFTSRLLLCWIPSEVCGMPTQGDNRPVAPFCSCTTASLHGMKWQQVG